MSMSTDDARPLQSTLWYRVRHLRPRLAGDVQVRRQFARGEQWQVLHRQGISRRVRINQSAWSVIGRCTGQHSLDDIWAALAASQPESLPAQDDLVGLLGKLVNDGLLACDDWPDPGIAHEERQRRERRERRQRLNPLAPRLALGSPDRWLARGDRPGRCLFSPPGAAGLLLLGAIALLVLATHWDELLAHARRTVPTMGFAWLSWCLFPFVKLLHEAAHGLAVRRFGGQVGEAGIGLLMLLPAPYVDASDAGSFARPAHRALVSAAGIVTELALAAIALLGWSLLADGALRDGLLAVMVIGTVSTLMFNANPLVRLDGYYMLSDLAQLPNLAQRSTAFWRQQWHSRLMGLSEPPLQPGPGERRWLWGYAPAAWLYRVGIMVWLTGFVGAWSRVAGVAIALAAFAWLVLVPLARLFHEPARRALGLAERTRAWRRLTVALAVPALLGLAPMPDRALVPALVWPADEGQIRARASGFIAAQPVTEHDMITAGQPVLTLHDPALQADIQALQAQIKGLESAWIGDLREATGKSRQHQESLREARERLVQLLAREAELTAVAPQDGRLRLIGQPRDQAGRYVREGELLGLSVAAHPVMLRAMLDQPTVARLRAAIGDDLAGSEARVGASFRLDESPGQIAPARIVSLGPTALSRLPGPALADRHGGPIAVQPGPTDEAVPVHPHFQLALQGLQPADAALGTRAWVRLDFGWRPLAVQAWQGLLRSLNTRLAPGWD
ncbi:MAG: efflux RND transporter periplasmic adaptor subunit [Burkholderiaceae bacterium]